LLKGFNKKSIDLQNNGKAVRTKQVLEYYIQNRVEEITYLASQFAFLFSSNNMYLLKIKPTS
jgi:hypothetical protein